MKYIKTYEGVKSANIINLKNHLDIFLNHFNKVIVKEENNVYYFILIFSPTYHKYIFDITLIDY